MNHLAKGFIMKMRAWVSTYLYAMIGVCLLYGNIQGLTLWNGILIAANVTNDNIEISGSNTIASQVIVEANSGAAYTVQCPAGSTSITSTANAGNLSFVVSNNSSITIFISGADLTLTTDNVVTEPFLFTVASSDGTGVVRLNLGGGSSLTLTGDPANPNLVGTRMFVIMRNPAYDFFLITKSPIDNPVSDSFFNILNNSLFSFLAPTAVSVGNALEQSTVFVDASNLLANQGTLKIVLDGAGSGFIIEGHQTANATTPTNADIDMSVPAGLLASVLFRNGQGAPTHWSGAQVLDSVSSWGQLIAWNGECTTNFPTYTGARHGFIVGANGNITIGDGAYLLFLDGTVNETVVSSSPLACGTDSCCITALTQLYKQRNPGALIVDGNPDPFAGTASITLQGESLLAFASTVDCCGNTILSDEAPPFNLQTNFNPLDPRGSGAIVFDVEGPLNVTGVTATTGLELLSLNVTLTGGSALINGTSTVFPLRTYAVDFEGNYLLYGNACWLINNIMSLFTTNLKHTFYDTNNGKRIFPNNRPSESEPTIISGEREFITALNQPNIDPGCGGLNVIRYYNSNLLLHTSLALNVDQAVPNLDAGNTSSFVFYTNGYCIDQGRGRQLILGTDVGSLASDGAHVIYHDSQLDVIQTTTANTGAVPEVLNMIVGLNNQQVTQGLSSAAIVGQTSVNTVYLAHESNISIGTNLTAGESPFLLVTFPTLNINGNYINFTSQGGRILQPGMSMSTGEGGVFVDSNGIFNVGPNILFAYGTMVTKSGNGVVNLPKSKVLPLSTVGVAQWHLNLADPTQLIVVDTGQHIANFTIDWENTTKNFCDTEVPANNYVPYFKPIDSGLCPVLAGTTPVVQQNLNSLPTVQGRVDQLQMKNSRVGDASQLIVDGGIVDEVLYFNGVTDPSIAPVGTIILRNDGFVGLGTASRNIDSLQASIVLGVNGVTLLADGNGTVRLNENVLVNNLCSFLTGPNFGAETLQQLTIESEVPREIRVKSDGILDLTQFTNSNQRLNIAGQVSLVLEPGATVVLGGGDLYFIGNSQLVFEPFVDEDTIQGTTLASTDEIRVKWMGSGRVTIQENATARVVRGAYVGIETDTCLFGAATTIQSWRVADSGSLNIGDNETYGGVFQVGNTVAKPQTIIAFTLMLDGQDALVQVNSQGFLGLGMGVSFNQPGMIMNSRFVGKTYNVAAITLDIASVQVASGGNGGTLAHQTIFSGASGQAGLIALGPDPVFTFQYSRDNGEVLGGGNILVVTSQNTGLFNPVITTNATVPLSSNTSPLPLVVNPATLLSATDNLQQAVVYGANILSSQTILQDPSKTSGAVGDIVTVTGTPMQVFLYLGMLPYNLQSTKMVTVARSELGRELIGFVYQNPSLPAGPYLIWRENAGAFYSNNGSTVGPDASLAIGTAGASINGYPPSVKLSVLNP